MQIVKKSFYGVVAGVAAVASLSGVVAHAASSDTTTLSLTVTSGGLNITDALATKTLEGVTIDTATDTSTTSVDNISVTDLTGAASGWTAKVKFSNLTGVTTNTKFLVLASDVTANFAGATKYLRVTPSSQEVVSGSSLGACTQPSGATEITALSGLNGAGESNRFSLICASSGSGSGSYLVDMSVALDIPAYGNYPGSVTSGQLSAQEYQGTATYDFL
jgi:hypothetical protein